MNANQWRYAYASVIGVSHLKSDLPCQDASECQEIQTAEGASILIAVVSDGAGSANLSQYGSKLACDLFLKDIRTFFSSPRLPEELDINFIKEWIRHFQYEISKQAELYNTTAREFACTILGAIIGTQWAAFFQIGDGAIVVSEELGEYNWVFWPQKGEYENTTVFATEPNAIENIQFDFTRHSISEVSLFTDGLQSLALHYHSRTAHQPFFRPMFLTLKQSSAEELPNINSMLASFLNLPSVNARTDDDKTLIIAVRRRS